MWDLIVSVPDHCLSFYSECDHTYFTRSTVVVAFSFVNENETNTKRKRNEKDP